MCSPIGDKSQFVCSNVNKGKDAVIIHFSFIMNWMIPATGLEESANHFKAGPNFCDAKLI